MALNLGTGTVTAVYVGSTAADAVYLGDTPVWSAEPETTPVAFRAASSNGINGSGGATLTVPIPTGVQAGDAMILLLRLSKFVDFASNVPTPAGWTQIGVQFSANDDIMGSAFVYTRTATGGDTAPSVTLGSGDAGDMAGAIVAYSSAALPTTVAFNEVTTSTTTIVAPSVTGVAGGELLCAWMQGSGSNTAGTTTYPGGMTERVARNQRHVDIAAAGEALAADGATGTRTATRSVSFPYVAASLVVPPA